MPARTITHNGLTMTIPEWAKHTNQQVGSLRYRLNSGWPIEAALFRRTQMGRPRASEENVFVAIKLEREFGRLVLTVDNALRTFRNKLHTLLPDADTPGVVENIVSEPNDRCHPSIQDSTN